jgi:methylenetetrahydrofolate reductase (NADPH)
LAGIVDDLYRRGYRNIMTLRGDPPKGATQFQVAAGGLAHASDLVALIKQHHPDIGCGVAGYPEKHPEADTLAADIRHLKLKVDAGADFITTQLFFENRFYLDFVARCRAAGIHQPIVPGLLPAVSLAQAQRMTSRCQTALPAALADAMQAAGGEGAAAEQIGIEWSARQIRELLERDVPGIHLYVLNRSKAALSPALLDCFARFRKP